ncbi:MAG: DNA ligase, partial [Candidatus Aenigmarchaeota archaeon CG_4_10_14_0_8_um_filter_37_24]
KYSILTETYERLEKEPGKLKKTEILSELLKKTPNEVLPKVVLLASGKIFPESGSEKVGIAAKMMIKSLTRATGLSEKEIIKEFKKTGDLGMVAENCIQSKKQSSLFKKELTIGLVLDNLQKLSQMEGKGSQERKMDLISQLLVSSKPKEARYITRTALETLRIGVAEGIVRDAIAQAFNIDKKSVENAWFLNPDYGEIARIAKEKGEKGLKKVSLKIGKPYIVMLGESSPTLKEALEKYEECMLEYKYDGVRTEIHKKGDKILLFTRRLEDITDQFPDLVELCKQGIKCEECIIEGETVGIDPKTNQPIPFQQLSRRVQRKYDIKETIKKIPIRVYLFDAIQVNRKTFLDESYKVRRKELEKMINPIKGKLELSHSLITKDLKEAEEFYKKSLKEGQEGLMVKNINAKYQPGRRVGQWLKVKPVLEPLDLAIVGAEWGTGKRSKWFGSLFLACIKKPYSNEYLTCGKLGTGLSDEQFQELTKQLKGLILEEKGTEVRLKPEVIVEVGYEEIQKSTKYESGYALRFPRLIGFKPDRKLPNELQKIEKLFKQQP